MFFFLVWHICCCCCCCMYQCKFAGHYVNWSRNVHVIHSWIISIKWLKPTKQSHFLLLFVNFIIFAYCTLNDDDSGHKWQIYFDSSLSMQNWEEKRRRRCIRECIWVYDSGQYFNRYHVSVSHCHNHRFMHYHINGNSFANQNTYTYTYKNTLHIYTVIAKHLFSKTTQQQIGNTQWIGCLYVY